MNKPDNWGACFDAAGLAMMKLAGNLLLVAQRDREYELKVEFPPGVRLCHGIGMSNVPGKEPHPIGHAWIEKDGEAYDCVWMVHQDAATYRANLKLTYVVEYTGEEMLTHWLRTDVPGPWDEKIKAITDRAQTGQAAGEERKTMTSNITTTAMLSSLSISVWSAHKFDKKATKDVADWHGTDEKVGRYNKKLFPEAAQSYKAIGAQASAARKRWYDQTLAWLDDGQRILPAANYLHCCKVMKDAEAAFRATIPPFIEELPFLIKHAETKLGTLFRREDYPSREELQDKFDFELKFYPLPDAGDFRVEISSEAAEAIKAQITDDVQSTIAKAMEEPYLQLFDGVAHMAARLAGQPHCVCRNCKTRKAPYKSDQFSDTLVDNLVDICDRLPRLNLTGDQNLNDMVDLVKASLTSFSPGALRSSEPLKKSLAERAAEIQRDLAGFMGQNVAA